MSVLNHLHSGPIRVFSDSVSAAASPGGATVAAPRRNDVEGFFFAAAETELPPVPRLTDLRRALRNSDR